MLQLSLKNQMTIPSNPMTTHIVNTPNEKQSLPCFSPVFTTSPNIITTLQQNDINTPTTTPFEHRDSLHHLTPPPKHALSFPWHPKQPEAEIENPKTEQIYVHPLVKRSSSSLSSKSLEMCTESLGSETGNDIISNLDDFYHQYALEKQSSCKKTKESPKKIKKPINFPPPLSSISGNRGVQVKTHREDGRLVIKAVSFSCCRNYFQAERENGRLKLSFVRDEGENHDELSQSEEQEEEENVNGEVEKDYCDGESEDEEGDLNGGYWGGENCARDDGGKMGCKINGGDWSGGGRCNGDRSSRSKRLPSLPFCVAIS